MKTFIPRALNNLRSPYSFATMSMAFWDFATDMKKRALSEYDSLLSPLTSFYVFPAIVFYCASFEALISEYIGLEFMYEEKEKAKDKDKEILNNIRAGIGEFKNANKRIKAAAKCIDREHKGNIDQKILMGYLDLSEVRNLILHYNPDVLSSFNWPLRLQAAFQMSKVKPINGDWVLTFQRKEVLLWVEETVTNIIKVFIRLRRDDEERFFDK